MENFTEQFMLKQTVSKKNDKIIFTPSKMVSLLTTRSFEVNVCSHIRKLRFQFIILGGF